MERKGTEERLSESEDINMQQPDQEESHMTDTDSSQSWSEEHVIPFQFEQLTRECEIFHWYPIN